MADPRLAVLGDRFRSVEERIQSACARAGRRREEVTLVAVTKTVSVEIACLLPAVGQFHLGESRPQELWRKAAVLPPTVLWHLVGHLQRNKIERTLPLVHLVHSVDSLRLLTALEEEAKNRQRHVDALLEVNASGEASKHGFAPDLVPQLADAIANSKHVRVRGLMTMAALEDDPERTRPTFAETRELRGRLKERLGPSIRLDLLSMGMSNDFEVAVEEGATLVRIGTALFEGMS
ncbi:MAG TPA: YggS family pyridoxal phosphate-dependent enzyme [Gemmataceae bacterium]|nr:YggS family pyridoxal phosphate-dependent enzyme [Gemmataceae bacterium]